MPCSPSAPPGKQRQPRKAAPTTGERQPMCDSRCARYDRRSSCATASHRIMRLAACRGPSKGLRCATSRLVSTGRFWKWQKAGGSIAFPAGEPPGGVRVARVVARHHDVVPPEQDSHSMRR
eukprot:5018589-Alexandrium_andersonii.AAC.1